MEPIVSQIVKGVYTFFSANFWFEFLILVEQESISDGFYSELKILLSDKKWNIAVYFISSKFSRTYICSFIAKILKNERKIVMLHSTPHLAKVIFKCTQYVPSSISWFLTDKVFTRNRSLLKYYPVGALAVAVTEQTYLEEMLKDSMSVVVEAIAAIPARVRSFSLSFKHDCWKIIDSEQFIGEYIYR